MIQDFHEKFEITKSHYMIILKSGSSLHGEAVSLQERQFNQLFEINPFEDGYRFIHELVNLRYVTENINLSGFPIKALKKSKVTSDS